MKAIEKLAKALDFRTETEYFDYCIDSHINGNFSQCKRLFNDMNKAGKKALIVYIAENQLTLPKEPIYTFYFELLQNPL